jgi:Spy/CpxP family protein refolding chaperone
MLRVLRPAFPVLIVLLAGAAGSHPEVFANQQGGRAWWRNEGYAKQLGLKPDQITRVEAIWQETRPELQAEMEELGRREEKLSSMIEQNAEEVMVIRQIDRVESARANLNKTWSVMAYRMRAILTAVQRKQLEALVPPATSTGSPLGTQGPRPPSTTGGPASSSPTGSSPGRTPPAPR